MSRLDRERRPFSVELARREGRRRKEKKNFSVALHYRGDSALEDWMCWKSVYVFRFPKGFVHCPATSLSKASDIPLHVSGPEGIPPAECLCLSPRMRG